MKRALTLLCAVMLVLLPLAGAHAAGSPKNGYILPEELKKIPAKVSAITLPEGLPEPARVTEFSVSGAGRLTLTLDREVPKLVITEINFVEATENTIFSKRTQIPPLPTAPAMKTAFSTSISTGTGIPASPRNTTPGTVRLSSCVPLFRMTRTEPTRNMLSGKTAP